MVLHFNYQLKINQSISINYTEELMELLNQIDAIPVDT